MANNIKTSIKIDDKDLISEPSSVTPEVDVIRNIERALDGTVNIDVVAEKNSITFNWELITSLEYNSIKNSYKFDSVHKLNIPQNLNGVAVTDKEFYVDSVSGTPIILNGEFYFQDISVKFVEV